MNLWIGAFAVVLVWVVIGLLIKVLYGVTAGLVSFALGMLSLFFLNLWRLSALDKWSRSLQTAPPLWGGFLDEVSARFYHRMRADQRHISEVENLLNGFREAAQALPDGVILLDVELHIHWCNAIGQQHLGLKLPGDQGQVVTHLVRHPEFIEYLKEPHLQHDPVLIRISNDAPRTLQIQLVKYGSGQHLLLTRDITQLERLETTRRDFVANVSHELRTPLTVLSGFLETLRELPENAILPEQKAEFLKLMQEQAWRMQAIVNDLLILAALESTPCADPMPVTIAAILNNTQQQAEALSQGAHQFDWEFSEQINLLGSETELASAFINLLSNAVRYTQEGGRIEAGFALQSDGSARFWVSDNGPGIELHHIPRLTERFYRVDRGRSRDSGGTGLGLAIVKHIALRHQAELVIESTYGKGSTFSIIFPPQAVITEQLPQNVS